mmetsp:Transcript_10835/g.21432  ORF Transcript_10835/g.21432 Transcript_10835/m.21432 type:complete len:352 (-) Transcript_10835:88-1143(-)
MAALLRHGMIGARLAATSAKIVSRSIRPVAAASWRGMSGAPITAAMVKVLREKTGSPMMDCKRALEDAAGDQEKALEWLRKKGIATAAKKESRRSADGLVCALIDASGTRGSVVEVNSETDFVARNPIFQSFVTDVCSLHLAQPSPTVSIADFKAMSLEKGPQTPGKISVEAAVKEMVATVGENCQMRSATGLKVDGPGGVFRYMHTPMGEGLGKVAVLVGLQSETTNKEALAELGYSLAMHIAAGKPEYTRVEDIPEAAVEKEKRVYVQQAEESGKTREIAEKMTAGRIKKWHEEVVLLEQVYLLGDDGKSKVSKVLDNAAKNLGAKVSLTGFVRVKCGEVAAVEEKAAE